ncbi:MAG TPA: M23 family metallopeptidase [Spirochaetota bacterium]|nr:M23 family metallopeptidase [Spirochaetota bacterium]
MVKKIITVLIAGGILSALIFSCTTGKGDIIGNPRNYFASEAEYLKFMRERVSFSGINLNFISVEKGDNFWKLAREHHVNIDTLIGINLFWNDLKAREGRVVIVPSEQGIVEFVNDTTEITSLKEIYGVTDDDIVVQERPLVSWISDMFSDEKYPVAVFIRDARPMTKNMSANLAGKFNLREMFRSPLGGRYSSFFGNRKHPIYRSTRFHNGIDIASPYGTFIGASRDGRVASTGWMGAYGKAVMIEHDNGYRTLYGHMSAICVKPGQQVKAGKLIGKVGSTGLSTGPHLHFTLWHDGRLLNPMDVLW